MAFYHQSSAFSLCLHLCKRIQWNNFGQQLYSSSFLFSPARWAHSALPVVSYAQGQYPDEQRKVREYFYYVDHQGFLFLDDSRMKNFTSCFKEAAFLQFFFQRLRLNKTNRYRDTFPFVSICTLGTSNLERNYVRCDDLPIVFTKIISPSKDKKQHNNQTNIELLEMNHSKEKLCIPFRPHALFMDQRNGRVYHPADAKYGGVGLIKSSLAIELSRYFDFQNLNDDQHCPTHFTWNERQYELSGEAKSSLESLRKQIGDPINFYD